MSFHLTQVITTDAVPYWLASRDLAPAGFGSHPANKHAQVNGYFVLFSLPFHLLGESQRHLGQIRPQVIHA